VSVVADPWMSYNVSLVKTADKLLVYDEVMEARAIKYGIPKEKIVKTGWWVRKQAYKKYKKEKSDRPVIFVGGGSMGNSSLPKLLLIILSLRKPVKFIIATGTDKFALKMSTWCEKLTKLIGKGELIKFEIHPWIKDIGRVVSQCDIVLGKGGPNFIFECIALHKPFVMITHIGGQEDGNVKLIREKRLGWVREGVFNLRRFLGKYLRDPEKYNKMHRKSIREEAARNKITHQKFTSIVAFPR